jgi:hypothetical protein
MKPSEANPSPSFTFRGFGSALFVLSAAALLFEINLTRLFSVSQFYHFAFMIVSIALLGSGASGTVLAVFPGIGARDPAQTLRALCLAAGASILGSYLLVNGLPFDSFRISWDPRQAGVLILYYFALAAPFFFCGMAAGLLLSAFPKSAGRVYAANLIGSSAGCLAALAAPVLFGGEGTVMVCAGSAALAALAVRPGGRDAADAQPHPNRNGRLPARRTASRGAFLRGAAFLLLLFSASDSASRVLGRGGFGFLEIRLSPYKGLSYVLQQPGAESLSRAWNAFSRVDVVRSAGLHSLPGLSYRYLEPLPAQDGVLIDGDDLSPILDPAGGLEFAGYLPAAPAFRLRPQADVLVLEPRGGLDVLAALHSGARRVTAVEVNPLVARAAGEIYRDERVETVLESDRSYLRRTDRRFDLIQFSLDSSYHPVRSGAYSLGENYRYTVEAFEDALACLNPGGMLLVTRWLQYPPSEELRAFAIAVTALENRGADPRLQLAAWRGYNTATIVAKENPFTSGELALLRGSTAALAFDLIYLPDIREEETNRFNVLPESAYYRVFRELLEADPRGAFYAAYPFDVAPPTDDRPLFGHYFKWSQAGQVIAEFGKVWQPFGGAGYFVILGLLILAAASAAVLIALPLLFKGRTGSGAAPMSAELSPAHAARVISYFGCIGFGFLLVEIPLIQRFILYLDSPAYAMTAVVFSLLVFSGAGSACSPRLPPARVLAVLTGLLLPAPLLLPSFFASTLGLPLAARFIAAVLVLAPIGFPMGVAFPGGIRLFNPGGNASGLIPWIWTVNGAASVVASVLAALLALSFGFARVFLLGALCYGAAGVIAGVYRPAPSAPPPVKGTNDT